MAFENTSALMDNSKEGTNTRTYEPHKHSLKLKNQSGSEDTHYSLIYESLPDEFKLMVEKELKETEDGRKRGLQNLKEYMKSKGLSTLKDDLLLAVLRSCKYDMKKSKTKLKNFISSRKEIIKLLSTMEMKTMEYIIDDKVFGILPYRDKHGRVIFYTRPNAGNFDLYEVKDVGIAFLAAGLFALSFPITTVAGLTYFGECESDNFYIFYDIFRAVRKNMFYFFSLPIRVSKVEILNENYLCNWFFKIISPLIGKKIVDRVCLHGSNFDQFYQMYNPDILPEEFGGNMGPNSNEVYRQKFLDFIKDLRN